MVVMRPAGNALAHCMTHAKPGEARHETADGPYPNGNTIAVPIIVSGHNGLVCWDDRLQTYSAWIDVFGWGGAGNDRWLVSPVPHAGPTPWLQSPECRSMPNLVVGDELGQHLTVDSLRLDLDRRGLTLDSDSWSRVLDLRGVVARSFGEAVIDVREAGPVKAGPLSGAYSRIQQGYDRIRLDVALPNGNRYCVPSRLTSLDPSSAFNGWTLTLTEAAARIVDLVWSPFVDAYDSILLEVVYEVLDHNRPFSLVAGSLADWIAHGSGPVDGVSGDTFNPRLAQVPSYCQLSLEL